MVEQSPMAEMAPQLHNVAKDTINNHHHHHHHEEEEEEEGQKERGGEGGDGQPTSLHLLTKINDAHRANVADEHEYHNHQPIDELNDGRSTLLEPVLVNDVHMGLQKRATAAGNADDDDGMPMPTAQEEEAMAASTTVQQEQENL
jgi:hypothetical protein